MFGAAVALIAGPTDISAQNCPPELAAAKSALSAAGPSLPDQLPRSLAGARDEISAPRGQDIQAPRGQDVQAPRGEDIQAPRTLVGSRQDLQAPRGQDVQAPRGQDVQAPRGQDVQAPRSVAGSKAGSSKAISLVKEAEAACAKGDMTTAKAKAEAALAEMK